MKCEFDGTGMFDIASGIAFIVMIFLIFSINSNIHEYEFLVLLGSTALLFIVLHFFCKLGKGKITVDEEKLVVSYLFFSRSISTNSIAEIECKVETQSARWGTRFYLMLYIHMKSSKTFKFIKILNDVPIENPDEYKVFIDEQPMMKLCNMINERL